MSLGCQLVLEAFCLSYVLWALENRVDSEQGVQERLSVTCLAIYIFDDFDVIAVALRKEQPALRRYFLKWGCVFFCSGDIHFKAPIPPCI